MIRCNSDVFNNSLCLLTIYIHLILFDLNSINHPLSNIQVATKEPKSTHTHRYWNICILANFLHLIEPHSTAKFGCIRPKKYRLGLKCADLCGVKSLAYLTSFNIYVLSEARVRVKTLGDRTDDMFCIVFPAYVTSGAVTFPSLVWINVPV